MIMNKDSGMSKVSIIIPVYQTEDYIEECVRSYLAQTHEDLEVLLIDDGSTDGTEASAKRETAAFRRRRGILLYLVTVMTG